MALAKFNQDYKQQKIVRNIVICIYPKGISESHGSHLNYSLECFQKKLWEMKAKNEEIQIAFVYGDDVVYAKNFQKLKKGMVCYLESCTVTPHLSHVWFMGMALLEQKSIQDERENCVSTNELYLFTDKEFNRIEVNKILGTTRFQNVKASLTLVKCEGAGGGELEKYISNHGEIYMNTDF